MKTAKMLTMLFVFIVMYMIYTASVFAINSLDAADGFPANVVYVDNDGNVGIGTNNPVTTLDVNGTMQVASSNPGKNAVTAFFTNPSDDVDSAVSIDLGIGTAFPTEWRLMASGNSLNIGNAVVIPPAISIGSSHHVAINNGLSVGSSEDVAIHAGSGMIPMILITGKHGVVTFGEDYGIYAWGGQKAGYFSGDVYVSGNVGIGAAIESQQKLRVAGIAQFDLGGGSISMSTPGGWPGIIGLSLNGHRRDIIVDNSSIRILTSSTSSAAPAENGITIRENGFVGIGTNNPASQLDIIGAVNLNKGKTGTALTVNGSEALWYTGTYFSWGYGGSANYFADPVGIGTSSPGSYMLAVNGSAAKPGGGSWSVFSDSRLKNLNGSYERGLSEISRLNPVRYSYKENNELQLPADNECVGLVAQEVQSVIPEAVEENSKGYLMVNNDPIIWAMVNSIKQLKAENDQLKQRLDALEKAVNEQSQSIQSEWR
jgi:hypothetical protein